MKIKGFIRKYAVLLVAGALLVGAVVLNIRLNQGTEPVLAQGEPETEDAGMQAAVDEMDVEQTDADYFASFRAERDAVRATEIEYLDEVIAVSYSDAETLADAQAQKLALVENMEAEFTIENLLRAKGFSDAAVTFHKGSVNVVVDSPQLSSEQVAQILDVVTRETGESADNIKILSQAQ